MPDVDVVTEAVIPRPVAEVAAYAADPAHAPQWYANISRVEWEAPPPVVVGTTSPRCVRCGRWPTSSAVPFRAVGRSPAAAACAGPIAHERFGRAGAMAPALR